MNAMKILKAIVTLSIGFGISCSNKSNFESKASENSGDNSGDCDRAALLTCVPPTGDSDANKKGDGNGAGGDSNSLVSKNFDLVAVTQKVDMVWVVDNSGSMGNEVEQVRANIEKFIGSLGSFSDLRFSLISKKKDLSESAKNPIDLPSPLPANIEARQVDHIVRSRDALFLAATASCPASSINFPVMPEEELPELIDAADRRLCDQKQTITHGGSLKYGFLDDSTILNAVGTLSDFLRPDAKRIYVFVSDDDATEVTSENFFSYVSPFNKDLNPLVYGFVGLNKEDCAIARVGLSYIELAKKSGGKAFDICQQDWSQHFDDLTNHVRLVMKTEFRLDSIPREVVEVKLDGIKLSETDYQVEGRVVRIKPEILENSSEKIVVYYLQ